MLKAFLLKNGDSIYYKKSKSVNRTLSLDALIKNVMTNNKDNVRINLEPDFRIYPKNKVLQINQMRH